MTFSCVMNVMNVTKVMKVMKIEGHEGYGTLSNIMSEQHGVPWTPFLTWFLS